MDDADLLQNYNQRHSEQAFSELVKRYMDLVYSAASRQVGHNPQLAQEVVQEVFTALARKAGALRKEVVLSGWLYRYASYFAARTMRTELRRRAREQEAVAMNETNAATEGVWEHLAPFLDEAMRNLSARDRDAILLRYFEGKELRAVGEKMGISEEAARKRVTRALDKCRGYFSRRGLSLSASALAALIAAHSVSAAPAGLSTTVSTMAISSAATGSGALTFLGFSSLTAAKFGLLASLTAVSLATWSLMANRSHRPDTGLAPPPAVVQNYPIIGSGTLSQPLRLQELYAASLFPRHPILITELRFRCTGTNQGAVATIPQLQIGLSTTKKIPGTLSTVFAENPDPGQTKVFQGPLVVRITNRDGDSSSNSFGVRIPLTWPFLYDPGKGNLLVEVRNFSGSDLPEVEQAHSNPRVSRVFAIEPGTGPYADQGKYIDHGADILELGYTDKVPQLLIRVIEATDAQLRALHEVIMWTPLAGGVIRYTTDGSEPKIDSPPYQGSFSVTELGTLKARVFGAARPISDTVSAPLIQGGNGYFGLAKTARFASLTLADKP